MGQNTAAGIHKGSGHLFPAQMLEFRFKLRHARFGLLATGALTLSLKFSLLPTNALFIGTLTLLVAPQQPAPRDRVSEPKTPVRPSHLQV